MGTSRRGLPDPKFFELWNQIAQERDSTRRAPLIEELIELLTLEQARIRAEIKARDGSGHDRQK
jgi:hypothetical protein